MERKTIHLADRNSCTGCGACLDVCSKESITFIADGIHYYPSIDEDKCIQCGKCQRSCPALSTNCIKDDQINQEYFACWNNSDSERLTSTSGGIGEAITKFAIEQGYYVAGCILTDEQKVIHTVTNNYEEAKLFKGSKYVQSDCTGIYSQCLDLIEKGEKILFIGTPCQAEAFKSVIPKRLTDAYLTCSIICHGVNSPIVWKDFKTHLEKKYNSKISSYNFRSKLKGWQKKNGGPNLRVSCVFKNNKTFDQPSWANLFHCWFGQHYILRPSCFNCNYRTEQRNSDIVIGDFWGVEKIIPDADTQKGVSAIITTTVKGIDFIRTNPYLTIKSVDADKTKQILRGFINKKSEDNIKKELQRNKDFAVEYVSLGFYTMRSKYPEQTFASHLLEFIISVPLKWDEFIN